MDKAAASKPGGSVPVRARITALLSSATMFMYFIRVCVGSLSIDMREEFGWSTGQKAQYLASFYWGYICLQIPGGMMARRYGGRVVFGLGVVWPMICTILTPVVAHSMPFYATLLLRALMGFGESVTYPAMAELLSQWSPVRERARHCSFAYGGAYVGSVGALLATPVLSSARGWEFCFYLYGGVGLLWGVVWYLYGADRPDTHKYISADEREMLRRDRADEDREAAGDRAAAALGASGGAAAAVAVPLADEETGFDDAEGAGGDAAPSLFPEWRVWRAILSERSVWAVCVQNFSCNWVGYVLLAWLPSYFKDTWKVDVHKDALASGYLSASPFAGFAAMAIGGSFMADRLISGGAERFRVRFACQLGALTLSGGFLVLLAYAASSEALAAVFLDLAVVGLALHTSGYLPFILDVGGNQYSGLILSVSNTFGTVPGIVGVASTGYILDQTDKDYTPVFMTAVGVCALGIVTWIAWARPSRVSVPPPPAARRRLLSLPASDEADDALL